VDGADDRLTRPVVVDRLADRFDACGQSRLADEAIAPHFVEQLLLAHDAAAPLHEAGEHVEGLRFELDFLPVAPQHDAGQVELAVGKPQYHGASDSLATRAPLWPTGVPGTC